MRSIAAILIVGSTLFFLASIGLTAKAIADLVSPVTSSSDGRGGSSSISSSSGSSTSNSYTSLTPTGSSSIFSAISTASNINSDLITPSRVVSSTSAGASAFTKQNPAQTSFVTLPQQSQNENTDIDANESNGTEEEEMQSQGRPLQLNSNILFNDGVKLQEGYQINQIPDQAMFTDINVPVLRLMPVAAIPAQSSSLQRRLMLTSNANDASSLSSDDDTSKHHATILLILFSIQEAMLIALLIGSLAFLWHYNTVDFDAEYKTILSRQAETRNIHSADDAIIATRRRTKHIRTNLILFCILCLFLLAVFVSSFVLLGFWFTVADNLTIITIALDALTFFFLVMICVAMIYDLRRSKKEEHLLVSEGMHGINYMNDYNNQQMKDHERAPSVVSSIKSLSSFATPPGWSRVRPSSKRGRRKEDKKGDTGHLSTQIEQRQDEEEHSDIHLAHSQQPRESYDHTRIPPTDSFQPGMNTAQYVGQPLRRLSSLQDTSNYQSNQHNLISPPIGTPPPQPGLDIDASYPSHMLASMPSPSSAGQQKFPISEEDVEIDEDREEWIGPMSDTSSPKKRQRRPSPPNKIPLPSSKIKLSHPQSPAPESPSSVYSDVLLSPGTLCVAVPNMHGGTTMMPVSVGQAHQTPL